MSFAMTVIDVDSPVEILILAGKGDGCSFFGK
jgi:hypothetical protein